MNASTRPSAVVLPHFANNIILLRAEDITPYDHSRGKTEQVREMFDNIAPAYDRLNRAMSLGLDHSWRRKAVDMVGATKPHTIVDIATGTGDFALSLARRIPESHIIGLDLSEGMVGIGRRKVADAGLSDRIDLQVGDCLASPLPDGIADAVTVAFGVRNFADLPAGYAAMMRMLRPGGMLCVIELSTPQSPLIRPFYNLYARHIIPLMGRLVSKDNRAYSYLPESIAAVPCGERMTALMEAAGGVDARFYPLTFGVCTIYTAFRKK